MKRLPMALMTFAICLLGTTATGQVVERVADVAPGAEDFYPLAMCEYDGSLYFSSASPGPTGFWRYDGSEVTQVAEYFAVSPIVFQGDLYFFSFIDGNRGLYRYDGTSTSYVGYCYPTSGSMTEYNGALYFNAEQAPYGRELYRYDGSDISLVADLNPGYKDGVDLTGHRIVYQNELYFSGNNSGTYDDIYGLWKYDGTTVSKAAEGNVRPISFCVYNNEIYFKGSGGELWKFDGTDNILVEDIQPGPGHSGVADLIVYENEMYFSAAYSWGNRELMKYDGSDVTLVAEINPSGCGTPDHLTVFGSDLVFSANDGTHGTELFTFDGSQVEMVADVDPGDASFGPWEIVQYGDSLYLAGYDPRFGYELWGYHPATCWQAEAGSPADWFSPGNWTGGVPPSLDYVSIDNGGTAQIASGSAQVTHLYVGHSAAGSLVQTGGSLNVTGAFNLGRHNESEGAYSISGGSLAASRLIVGATGAGSLSIDNSAVGIVVSEELCFGANSTFSAVPGSVIHMLGADFVNESTDSVNLSGLSELGLVFEGGSLVTSFLEVAGQDLGAIADGFTDNFAFRGLYLGGVAVGEVQLLDAFDNQPGWAGVEALYVYDLEVAPGSILDLNGINLYYLGASIDASATILTNGGSIHRVPDFDRDGDVDADDIDALCANLGDTAYDLDDDGDCDADDFVYMVENLVEWNNAATGEFGHGTMQGDFNLDGVVNATDLAIMKAGFGQSGLGYAGGNANCDTVINATDLAILKAAFGSTVLATGGSPASASPIPEPTGLALLGVGWLAVVRRRKRCRVP